MSVPDSVEAASCQSNGADEMKDAKDAAQEARPTAAQLPEASAQPPNSSPVEPPSGTADPAATSAPASDTAKAPDTQMESSEADSAKNTAKNTAKNSSPPTELLAHDTAKNSSPSTELLALEPAAASARVDAEGGSRAPAAQPSPPRSAAATAEAADAARPIASTAMERVDRLFVTLGGQEALISEQDLIELLLDSGVRFDPKSLRSAVDAIVQQKDDITLGETKALVCLLQTKSPTTHCMEMYNSRVLSHTRPYMITGHLDVDRKSSMSLYMRQLDDHRKKCEDAGRYPEALAAKLRISQLKTAQAECMRSEIRHRQADEQQQIVTALTAERHRAQERWDAEIGSFEAAFTSQVKDLRAQQQANLEAAGQELLERQPEHQRFSKELLNQRFVQGSLARIGEYTRAHEMQRAADQLQVLELQNGVGKLEAEWLLKATRIQRNQALDLEAVLLRGARKRDELELHKIEEVQRHQLRLRNLLAELSNLHRAEITHMEMFLEIQAMAGKRVPLKESGFRKRPAGLRYSDV